MIEPLRRTIEAKPFLEPFCTGRVVAASDARVGDGRRASVSSSGNFDATQYAREAFSRARRGRESAVGNGSVLDDVAALAEGARTMEALIRDEVVGKRETLDKALRGVEEAETTMRTIREGTNAIADAVRRVATLLGEPHDAIEASTRTLERLTATGETLRGVVKVLKLTSKLRECKTDAHGKFSDVSELSKAAKLLGEIRITLKDARGDFDRVDVVRDQMAYIRERSAAISREANDALDRGMEAMSQANVGAALQVHYNLNDLREVVDARVAFHVSAAVESIKDAVDPEGVGRSASDASSSGDAARRGRHPTAPPSGAERAWIDALWRRNDAALDVVYENAMSVWHLQRVLAKKRDPLTATLFLEEVVGRAASDQALCDRFWAALAKGVSEQLSRTHAAAGFVAGALQKGFPRLVGALEHAVTKCARDADAAKGAPGCVRKDGTTRLQVLRAVDPISAAFFARSLNRLTEAANACFISGRGMDKVSVDHFLSRIRGEIDAVADYDNLLNSACGNASSALKALADRAKRSIGRTVEASSLLEEATPVQRANDQIAEQLSRVHSLLSKVLPAFATTPRRAMEAGLEHVAVAAFESSRPLFDAVGDFCDAQFLKMHACDYGSPSNAKEAQHVVTVTSTLAHAAEAHQALFTAPRGPLLAARLALGEKIARSFVANASLIRTLDQGGKMRLVKETGDVELALMTHLRLGESDVESSPEFKSIKAFKSLVLLPTESIENSPLVKGVAPLALLHHLYSRAPAELNTPAKRAGLNPSQYAARLLKTTSDAEIWRGVKATLELYEESRAPATDGERAALALMRKVGARVIQVDKRN